MISQTKIDIDSPQILQFEPYNSSAVACVKVILDGAFIGEYWVEERNKTQNYYVGTSGRKIIFGDTLPELFGEMFKEWAVINEH